jgi:hypothetical protein
METQKPGLLPILKTPSEYFREKTRFVPSKGVSPEEDFWHQL